MLTDKEVEEIVEEGADKVSDEDFHRLVEWVLREKEKAEALLFADHYRDQDLDD